MSKLTLTLAPLMLLAGMAGGYLAHESLFSGARGPVVEEVSNEPEITRMDAGRFAFILPGSILDKPAVFMVSLDVKTDEAPQTLTRLRDAVNEVLVSALAMPLVRTDEKVLEKMAWALPHAAEKSHPWLVGAELTLMN